MWTAVAPEPRILPTADSRMKLQKRAVTMEDSGRPDASWHHDPDHWQETERENTSGFSMASDTMTSWNVTFGYFVFIRENQ
jgi:hypothetical protein